MKAKDMQVGAEAKEFFFRARNPASGAEVAWRAHQHFADGTVADWVGPAG